MKQTKDGLFYTEVKEVIHGQTVTVKKYHPKVDIEIEWLDNLEEIMEEVNLRQ